MDVLTGRVPRRRRPPIVAAACGMLAAGGALFAGEVYLSSEGYFTEVRAWAQAGLDDWFAEYSVSIHWMMEVVGMFVGLALFVLAVVAFSGRGWARAVSWLFGLPILLWYGLQVSFFALSLTFASTGPPPSSASPEYFRRLEAAWPSWLDTLDTVLKVAVAVLLMAALVGQTLPAADAYFRKRDRA
jgi:uncharacterized membrane protein YgdD (TMEM256/DUF423 family)